MSFYFNQTNIAPGNSFASGGGGGGSNFASLTAQQILGVSTMSNTILTTDSNAVCRPIQFDFRPDQSVKGGAVEFVANWDAVDTGANVACVMGANGTTAYIGSQWLGYITAPMTIYGAQVSLVSDNETFLFGDGKDAQLGTLSTGVPFASSSNAFSSIISPAGDQADISALFSTLKSLYPSCFAP